MSVARSDSVNLGRRRSNTAQSIYKSTPIPLKMGDSILLTAWVHNPNDSPHVMFNRTYWPGVIEGDLLRISSDSADDASGFLFIVPRDEATLKYQLQVRCIFDHSICVPIGKP